MLKKKKKKSALANKTDEIQYKIDAHTNKMVEMVKKVGQLFVGNLRKVEKEKLEEIDAFMYTIEKKIIELQIMSKKLTANIQAKPHPSMFKLITVIV